MTDVGRGRRIRDRAMTIAIVVFALACFALAFMAGRH